MSARRFRHRDRQQARPGSPQQAPGEAPPGIRIRVSGILCPHTPPPGTPDFRPHTLRKSAIRHTTGIGCPNIGRSPDTGVRHTGLPAAYASEISDTAHHGHRVPEHRALAGHRRQAHRAPGRIRFGNQVSRVPDIRRCRASCVGHEKVGHEKGESGIGFPFGRPLLCPHPGRRGYFFSGRAIDSRIDVSAMMFFIL